MAILSYPGVGLPFFGLIFRVLWVGSGLGGGDGDGIVVT